MEKREAAIALHIFKRERYVNYKLWEVGTAGFKARSHIRDGGHMSTKPFLYGGGKRVLRKL